MRDTATILHLDLDAFFAAVEQRDKPSLRGKPVVVGGVGGRGVVATASYEARAFGIHSAMATHQARRLCPHAAFLTGRRRAYREASRIVMGLVREFSPVVEQVSIDEAYADLAANLELPRDVDGLRRVAEELRERVRGATGGLTASVGLGSSKFMAKVASEQAKPDGLVVVVPGTEADAIAALPVRAIPGVGPVTADKLSRLGLATIAHLRGASRAELTREVGESTAAALAELAYARDDRPVSTARETKSISTEHTFESDLRDRAELGRILARDAAEVAARVAKERAFARTVSIKVRLGDFTTLTRSRTLLGATDDAETMAEVGRELLAELDLREGVRLIGLGAANFTDYSQDALFRLASDDVTQAATEPPFPRTAGVREDLGTRYRPGADVIHDDHGPGWVWGAGSGWVTVRFETADTPPGLVKSFRVDDEALRPADEVP